MKAVLLPLALSLLVLAAQASPLPSTTLAERDPLPPRWCVWVTNDNGKGRHLDCSEGPPDGPGGEDPFGPDGVWGNLINPGK